MRIRASSFDVKPTGTSEDNGPGCSSCDSIAALDVAGDSPIFDLRRRQRMKARIPVTSNRAATAPMTGFATDAACGHCGDAFCGVVVLICIACTGILRKKLISHGKRDVLKTHFRANGANIAPCAGLTRKTMTLVRLSD